MTPALFLGTKASSWRQSWSAKMALALVWVGMTTAHAADTKSPWVEDQAPQAAMHCTACHGVAGEGSDTGAPRLAAQNADYLSHALSMFKAGTRISPAMQAAARNLSDDDIERLSRFFAAKAAPAPRVTSQSGSELSLAGQALAERGAQPDVPACFSCHGQQGRGVGARYPGIAGQPAAFVVARLRAFQARARTGTPAPGTMTAVAARMNDRQIQEAAAFLSALAP